MNSLSGKTVVITGASSGIGLACAAAFARRGANLVLAARTYVGLCEIAQSLEQRFGVRTLAVRCDVSIEADCQTLVGQATQLFGGIDLLVNNAC